MPTLMLKLLALTGVISAGCFAVWKANTELLPDAPKSPSEFTSVEGESEPNVGLGGQPISDSGAEIPDSPVSSQTPNGGVSKEEEELLGGQTLALAGQPFPEELQAHEKPVPRGMPTESPAEEQAEPAATVEPEPIEPVPGVTSLEHLEASEMAKSVGAAATKAPAINSKALTSSGTPSLIAIPKMAAVKAKTATPSKIVPVSAEEPTEAEPELLAQAPSEPDAPGVFPAPEAGEEIVPASDAVPATLPGLNVPAPRTRPVPNQPAEETPTLVDEPNPFEQDVGGAAESTEPAPVSEPTEASPINVRDRSRSTIPHETENEPTLDSGAEPSPVELNLEQQDSPTPNDVPAKGDAAGEHHPKSSLPRKPADDLLYGESTSEVPQLAPSQQPQLKIEKKAQAEAELFEKFIYDIIVQNVGQVPAEKVVVEERIPNNCKMERSSPTATLSADKVLRWELGTLEPGIAKTIKVEVTPQKAGPVGSVATVRFASMVSTKTMVTAPTLDLKVDYPKEAAVEEPVPVKFTLKNIGSATARNVTVLTKLPEGLEHQYGPNVSREGLTIKPNETLDMTLVVTPKKAGQFSPQVVVTANGVDQPDQQLSINIIPAYLTLTRQGHAQRFVKRPAESVTRVSNNSSRSIKAIQITEKLPEGLEPVVAELENASWNPESRVVTWMIPVLGPRDSTDIKLTVVSNREGVFESKMTAADAANHRAEVDSKLEVKGFAALALDIQGDQNAVAAVGEQVSMKVTVSNRGSATARGVQAVFEVPSEMKFITAQGPSKYTQDGNHITFAEIEELEPGDSKTYDIALTAAEEGLPKVAVELMSEDRPTPVRQEAAVTITPK